MDGGIQAFPLDEIPWARIVCTAIFAMVRLFLWLCVSCHLMLVTPEGRREEKSK